MGTSYTTGQALEEFDVPQCDRCRLARLVRCWQREEEVSGVLVPLSNEFTRDELLSLIDGKARRTGRDLGFVLHHYAAGTLEDFARLAEAYALCDLLAGDDPAFVAV